ncbi:unnamed protein product [Clonostachys solani]|uniref:F-box domain-containing protein n=1 Tax=Clonostachys solani TaxID=160281 RepID=A0A9N9ZGJ9_9HYPO|nr:unnamed protein product [Clonostachys solani]
MAGNDTACGPSLPDLPPEILSKVFSYLAGTPSIQAVLKTCITFYNAALPLSVSTFHNIVHPYKDGSSCSPSRNAQFLHYILISKPWLAQHVNTVVLGSCSTTGSDEANAISAEADLAVCRERMDSILGRISDEDHSEWWAEWIADLEKGCSDAQASLILLVCPNIRALLFEESRRRGHFIRLLGFLAHLFWVYARTPEPGIDPKIPLSNLQDVFHEGNDIYFCYTRWCEKWPMLFGLPRLRYYQCHLPFGDLRGEAMFGHLPPRFSLVEEITLRSAYIRPSTLSKLLNACKALRNMRRPEVTAPRELLESILLHAESLTELYINTEEDRDKGCRYRVNDILCICTGLRKMVALRKLTVGMQCLTGMLAAEPENNENIYMPLELESAMRLVDCLPENLEYLKTHSCGAAVYDQASELLRAVEQGHRFRHLTEICFLFIGWLVERPSPLYCTAPNVRLRIGQQTKTAYHHDLGHPYADGQVAGRGARNVTSHIHGTNLRREYLAVRGLVGPPRNACSSTDDP